MRNTVLNTVVIALTCDDAAEGGGVAMLLAGAGSGATAHPRVRGRSRGSPAREASVNSRSVHPIASADVPPPGAERTAAPRAVTGPSAPLFSSKE